MPFVPVAWPALRRKIADCYFNTLGLGRPAKSSVPELPWFLGIETRPWHYWLNIWHLRLDGRLRTPSKVSESLHFPEYTKSFLLTMAKGWSISSRYADRSSVHTRNKPSSPMSVKRVQPNRRYPARWKIRASALPTLGNTLLSWFEIPTSIKVGRLSSPDILSPKKERA